MEGQSKFIFELVLILIFTNGGGILASKVKQPAVLGQILAGLLIGPAVLNIVEPGEFISRFAEIGVLLLMFMAGMETNLKEMKRAAGSSTLIAIGGMILPFVLGFVAVKIIHTGEGTLEAIFTGVILTATSISITVQSLREFGKIRDKTGINILGAAIIDDVLGIVLLTVVIGISDPSKDSNPLFVILKIIVYFVVAIGVGKVISIVMSKFSNKMSVYITPSTIALICCLAFAYMASLFEIATIIGAYTAGIIFSTTPSSRRIDHDINTIGFTLFTPVFFANIGLEVSFNNIGAVIFPATIIVIAAVVGKVIGSGLGAKISKFSFRESLQIGIGMIPRGEVALITANLGKNAGIINDTVFTSIILMSIISTLITPIMLKKAYGIRSKEKSV